MYKSSKEASRMDESESSGSESDETEYEVEKILNRRNRNGTVEYLVNRKGFDNSWEPIHNLGSHMVLITAYEEKRKNGNIRKKENDRKKETDQKEKDFTNCYKMDKSSKNATRMDESETSGSRSNETEYVVKKILSH